MGKFAPDAMIDASLDYVAGGTRQFICSAEPANYTEASSTFMLAEVTTDSGDFSKANGDTSGRKLTIAAQTGVLIASTGTATHVAVCSAADTTLRYVTTCTSQALTANGTNTVNEPSWKIEIADPA